MSDDLDDLRSSLKRASDDFRPALDPAGLADAGRRNQRRRNTLAGIGGVGVLAVAIALVVPALMPQPSVVTAVPATTASPAVTASPLPPSAGPGPFPVINSTVSTTKWKTFTSKEFPVTFKYPTTWSLDGDGCDSVNCVLFVNPPEGTKAAPIELIRNGFEQDNSTGGGFADTSKLEVLGALPDLAAWSAEEGTSQTQALVVRVPGGKGHVDDYSLASGVRTGASLSARLSLGESSNWPEHPERVILFSTNTGNIGGTFDKAGRDTVIAILASTRPNPDFNPTRPTGDASGGTAINVYDAMPTPLVGAITSDSTWKTLSVKAANLSVRYPKTWKAIKQDGDIIWIKAPSGYIVDLLTNMGAESCDAGPLVTSESLGETSLEAGERSLGAGPVEIRWQNGGEFPVWLGLAQHSSTEDCFQRSLDFGGTADVYLGSADNHANPTEKELDQAVAILASATPIE